MFITKCVLLYMMKKVSHNVEGVVVLQNCLDILKSEPGSIIETCQVSCDDGNQIVGIKVEDVTDVKEEEDSWPATSTGIKTEPAVSRMCVCVCVSRFMHIGLIMYELYIESHVNGKFIASLDNLHYHCDILIPTKVVCLKESHVKFDKSRR